MSDLTTTITGNLADDPELRYTQSGVAVATIRVGVNNRTYNKTTQQYEDGETTWIRATAWRELAENITQTLTKGTRVVVTGKIKQPSAYQTATGETRASLELEIEDIGASLRYATATITKIARTTTASATPTPANDPWANPAPILTDDTPF